MPQFQGSLGPLQELEAKRLSAAPKPALEPVRSKGHASEHAGELRMKLRELLRNERVPYGIALTVGYLIPLVVYVVMR